MTLPVNIKDLFNPGKIESERIEFKEGWNPDAIYRSVCAFANDFNNTGGGYILIGVEEVNKVAQRPVKGLSSTEIARIQEQMIGFNKLIRPEYNPKLYVEPVDGREILVLWIPGGSNRPYEVPDYITQGRSNYNYRIRRYSSSVIRNSHEKAELIGLANQIPYDDRPKISAVVDDISLVLLSDYLRITGSRLSEMVESRSKTDIAEQMELLSGPPENVYPRNVSLMLFNENPETFFPYSRIEIVHFPKGADDPEHFEAPAITGPVQQQVKKALDYLKINLLQEKITKVKGKAESTRIWNYPFTVFEEAIANAIYHRDYSVREPVEIRIYPGSVVILNYGGPDRSIKMSAFEQGVIKPRRYRNRRLGDFLKELHLTEGKATGIPAIKKALLHNGSPAAHFDTDEERTYFEVEFFLHPVFVKLTIPDYFKESINLKTINDLLDWLINEAAKVGRDIAGDIANHTGSIDNQYETIKFDTARDIAGDIAFKSVSIDYQYEAIDLDVLKDIAGDIAGDIVGDIADQIIEVPYKILGYCLDFKKREEILSHIGLTKNFKNFNNYINPLIQMKLLVMTLPDRPTSPNQKYRTTLKGAILYKLLETYKKIGK